MVEGTNKPNAVAKAFSFFDNIIDVLVGSQEQVFRLHRALLVTKSKFFKAALTGSWAEAKTGIVKLPDLDADDFQLFAAWLYDSDVFETDEPYLFNPGDIAYTNRWACLGKTIDGKTQHLTMEQADELINHRFFSAYVLGDVLQSCDFRNKIIDILAFGVLPIPIDVLSATAINLAFRKTPKGCPLQRLLIDTIVFCRAQSTSCQSECWSYELLPKSFFFSVSQALLRKVDVKWKGPHSRVCIDYHEHINPAYRCTRRVPKGAIDGGAYVEDVSTAKK